jgi:hypothetical protein
MSIILSGNFMLRLLIAKRSFLYTKLLIKKQMKKRLDLRASAKQVKNIFHLLDLLKTKKVRFQ